MKLNKYFVIIFVAFISFIGLNKINALEIDFNFSDILVLGTDIEDANDESSDSDVVCDEKTNSMGTSIYYVNGKVVSESEYNAKCGRATSSSVVKKTPSNQSEICGKFNQVFYILGIALQIIYIATPILLIVTGMITFLKVVSKGDDKDMKSAQKVLTNKIIAAVAVFLMVTLTKMVISLVATDGWISCADCMFNPSQSKCGIEKIPTGE